GDRVLTEIRRGLIAHLTAALDARAYYAAEAAELARRRGEASVLAEMRDHQLVAAIDAGIARRRWAGREDVRSRWRGALAVVLARLVDPPVDERQIGLRVATAIVVGGGRAIHDRIGPGQAILHHAEQVGPLACIVQ